MNLFFTDRNEITCVKNQCDQHAVKMPLESAQMLCTAQRRYGNENEELYRTAYQKHPMTIWVGDSTQHYAWAYKHWLALLEEYTYRYDREHKSSRLIKALEQFPDEMPNNGWVDPPQCMPDEFKGDDCVEAYRRYYIYKAETKFDMRWTNRRVPSWFKSKNLEFLDVYEDARLTPSALLSV